MDHKQLDDVQNHIQLVHNGKNKVVCEVILFLDPVATTSSVAATAQDDNSFDASVEADATAEDVNVLFPETVTTSSGVTDSDNAPNDTASDALDDTTSDVFDSTASDTFNDPIAGPFDDTTADDDMVDDFGEASDNDSGIAAGAEDSSDPDYMEFDRGNEYAPRRPSSRGRQPRVHVRHSPYATRSNSESSSYRHSRPSAPRRLSTDFLGPSLANLHLQPSSRTHSPAPITPSPLAQVAFSRPNSNSPSQSSSSSQEEENPMDIDLPAPDEDSILLTMASLKAIPLTYLHETPTPLLIVCSTCQLSLQPNLAISHAKSKHQIPLKKDEKKSIQAVLNKPSIIKKPSDITPPKYPCPPIDGLEQKKGLICTVCHYCCCEKGSMNQHFSKHHRSSNHTSNTGSKPATVQVFSSQNRAYFQVLPVLSGMSQDNLFTIYLEQVAPLIDSLHLFNPPLDHNEVPPLLKVTQWHEHLAEYIDGDKNKVRLLLELTQPPTSAQDENSWLGGPLRKTIEAYMKDAAHKGNSSTVGLRRLLMECPMLGSFFVFSCLRILTHTTSSPPDPHAMAHSGHLFQTRQSINMLFFFNSGHMQSWSPWMEAMHQAINSL